MNDGAIGKSSARGLEEHWYGALMYGDNIAQVADSGMELQTMLEVVQVYMMSRKREGGTSWKIGEEIMEEVEEFK